MKSPILNLPATHSIKEPEIKHRARYGKRNHAIRFVNRVNLWLADLAVGRGGIVARPEDVEEVVELAGGDVVVDADDLVVVGGAGADVLVGRVVEVPLAVSHLGASHAGDALERELHAPEAPGAELRELVPGRRAVLIGALRQRRRRRRRPRASPSPPSPSFRASSSPRNSSSSSGWWWCSARGSRGASGGGEGRRRSRSRRLRGGERRGGEGTWRRWRRGEEASREAFPFRFGFCGGVAQKLRRAVGWCLGAWCGCFACLPFSASSPFASVAASRLSRRPRGFSHTHTTQYPSEIQTNSEFWSKSILNFESCILD